MIKKIVVEDDQRVYEFVFRQNGVMDAFCRKVATQGKQARRRLKL